MGKLIKIYTNEVDGGWNFDGNLFGSEEAVRETAKAFVKRGHKVMVFYDGNQGCQEGVFYLNRDNFNTQCDVLIVYKEPELLDSEVLANKTYYWTNEIDVSGKLTNERLEKIDKVIAHSEWQREHTMPDWWDVSVIPLGVEMEPGKKTEKLCIYASSPDRGLEALLKRWPDIKKAVPEAKLLVTYTDKTYPEIDGVSFLGLTSEKEMRKIYSKASVWLYPCNGVELFCLTAVKAQASGVIPVVIPHMALSETVKFGVKTTIENFTKDAVDLLVNESRQVKMRSIMKRHRFSSWDDTINKWEKLWKD